MQEQPCLLIWNPSAGSALKAEEMQRQARSHPGVTLCETSSGDEARRLASEATEHGFDMVVAAGGDGTVNAVVNGLYESSSRAVLGILPLGTGNDLCRTLKIPLNAAEAFKFLIDFLIDSDEHAQRSIDLVRVESERGAAVFANLCSGGNSQRVGDHLTDEMKRNWGAWSYLRGAIGVLTDLAGFNVTAKFDDEQSESFNLWNIVVANGKTVAGGLPVATRAEISDGLLDVILIQNGAPLDVAALSAQFFLGDYLENERVVFRHVRRAEFHSDPPIQFVADGESLAVTPVTFSIKPNALRVVAPPSR